MDFWKSLGGMLRVELTTADPAGTLGTINAAGITIYHAQQESDLVLRFGVQRQDYRRLRALTKKRGEKLELSRRQGLYWVLRQLIRRPVLVAGILLILILTLYLPTRILFVEVEGNLQIPVQEILERAEGCGIGLGASRRLVRSERMKNRLLSSIPDLQWAGINTYGCRAVISVRERTQPEDKPEEHGISSIVATREGVIREITVLRGEPLCKVGQAVKSGQVLISGYMDRGICIRGTRAQGEIFAETERNLTAVLPSDYAVRGKKTGSEKKYSLIIGKKRINFYKGSGISDSSCDKMYSVRYLTLPGGFRLPIALVTEEWSYYDSEVVTMEEDRAQQVLTNRAGAYLLSVMTAGQIQTRHENLQWSDGVYCLKGRYACLEMIGKTRLEENLESYE